MQLRAEIEKWPIAGKFTISRGSRTEAVVIVAQLEENGLTGRGEATPYARYDETPEKSVTELKQQNEALKQGESPDTLLAAMAPGAARNAFDAAWWDLRCKREGRRITELLGHPPLRPIPTAYTLSIDTPDRMEAAARAHAHRPLLKIKTGSENVIASVEAVRRGAPTSQLIVDANEAWRKEELAELMEAMARLKVELIEQPLPADEDDLLASLPHPVPVFADESIHTAADIPSLVNRYDGVNLKLDKTGGLTEALLALAVARKHQLKVMCGCMLGTSLAMAPAMALAQQCDITDLDAPLLLAKDRADGITYDGSLMLPYNSTLWG